MRREPPQPGPPPGICAERLLRAVADELGGDLGRERLSPELVTEIHSRLTEVLASSDASLPEAELSASGVINELALAIYLVVVGWGYTERNPLLLSSLERALERELSQPTTGGT